MSVPVSESNNLTNHNWLKHVWKKCANLPERENEMAITQIQGRKKEEIKGQTGKEKVNIKHKTGGRRGETEK